MYLSEKPFEIEGDLRVRERDVVIFIADQEFDQIKIDDENFLNRLLGAVPCLVGGEFLYRDRVRLLVTTMSKGKSIIINAVLSGSLIREREGRYNF